MLSLPFFIQSWQITHMGSLVLELSFTMVLLVCLMVEASDPKGRSSSVSRSELLQSAKISPEFCCPELLLSVMKSPGFWAEDVEGIGLIFCGVWCFISVGSVNKYLKTTTESDVKYSGEL